MRFCPIQTYRETGNITQMIYIPLNPVVILITMHGAKLPLASPINEISSLFFYSQPNEHKNKIPSLLLLCGFFLTRFVNYSCLFLLFHFFFVFCFCFNNVYFVVLYKCILRSSNNSKHESHIQWKNLYAKTFRFYWQFFLLLK